MKNAALTEQKHVEPAHSPLGPSSADRWINCPGSVLLTQGLPDVDSEYSIEGTVAHSVLEAMREYGKAMSVYKVKLADGASRFVDTTPEMVAGAQYFMDHMSELPGTEFSEQRIRYDRLIHQGFGTLDGAKATDDTLYIRDYKYGKGVIVYAERNPQLMLYAVGFFETFSLLFPNIQKINLGVVQPRLDHIDVWECDLQDLYDWMHSIAVPAAERAQSPNAEVVPGDWCQFCKIKTTCMVRAAAAVKEVIGEFTKIESPQTVVSAQMTVKQLAAAMASVPLLEDWIKDIKAAVKDKLINNDPDMRESFKLVEGRGSRRWKLEPDAIMKFLPALDDNQFYHEPEFKSVAQIETTVGKKAFRLIADEISERVPGQPTVAPIDDKRPALTVDASEFTKIGEDE